MTEQEQLALLEEVFAKVEGPEDAFTTDEWCEMLGLGREATRKRLRSAKKANRLERIEVMREALDGRRASVPAYRLLQ
jgi:Lon protease-like protein